MKKNEKMLPLDSTMTSAECVEPSFNKPLSPKKSPFVLSILCPPGKIIFTLPFTIIIKFVP